MPRNSQTSGGLLAFRRHREVELFLAHPGGPYWAKRDDGAWTIPKGVADPGVDLLTTAQREFREETGFLAAGPFIPLKPVKQRNGKTVHAWAFEGDFDPDRFASNTFQMEWPPRSGWMQEFPEIDRVGWFSRAAALTKIIAYQRPFVLELDQILSA